MLSNVTVSGLLTGRIEGNIRYVETRTLTPDPNGKFSVFEIPVFNKMGPKASFFTADPGTLVLVKGRLETMDGIGLVVVSEIEELYPAAKRD